MDPFDWVESASTMLEEEPRVLATRFGDGYGQRSPDGLNPIAQRWELRFSAVDNAVADAICAYWRTAGGVQAFEWTPLWHTTPIKVVCTQWTRSQPDRWGMSDLTARFEQVFEP